LPNKKNLELEKIADKSGPPPSAGQPWPLVHVLLTTDPKELPEYWEFSDNFVDRGVDEGWIEFQGEPFAYEIHPDPTHPDTRRLKGPMTRTEPGDRLVLHLVRDGKPIDVTYRIKAGPVPRHYRIADKNEPSGFAAPHFYAVELEKEKKS